MRALHTPSFYLGAHTTCALIALGLTPFAPWLLLTFAWSAFWARHFWKQLESA